MFNVPSSHIVSMATNKIENICKNQKIFVWQHVTNSLGNSERLEGY